MFAASAQRAQEQKQRERAEVRALAAEAVTRLSGLGDETFVRAQPAMRFHRGEIYRDPDGQRYQVASEQRCWVLSRMSGIRDEEGPWMDSPVLLLADGTIGRFWPIPLLHPAGRERPGRYVSGIDLDPVDDGRAGSLFRGSDESYVASVKRRLAEAVVSYERLAR